MRLPLLLFNPSIILAPTHLLYLNIFIFVYLFNFVRVEREKEPTRRLKIFLFEMRRSPLMFDVHELLLVSPLLNPDIYYNYKEGERSGTEVRGRMNGRRGER
jgi:hypothetical protein